MRKHGMLAVWMFLATISACSTDAEVVAPLPAEASLSKTVRETVDQIQKVECWKTDSALKAEGINNESIIMVRGFCALSTDQMTAEISARFMKASGVESGIGKTTQQVYTCSYDGANFDIPTYADLGLTDATCIWHDPNPGCRIQGLVACLWGCNNNDPVLGWHTKWYASRSAVEADLFPKGYAAVNDYAGGSYRRGLERGYSYQVYAEKVDENGQGIWHCEGPEPDPRFSWYAYLGGWWPSEVQSWHQSC